MKEVTNNTTKSTNSSKEFIALRNKEGHVVAFINPAKHVNPQSLVASLQSKGLSVAIESPNNEEVSVDL